MNNNNENIIQQQSSKSKHNERVTLRTIKNSELGKTVTLKSVNVGNISEQQYLKDYHITYFDVIKMVICRCFSKYQKKIKHLTYLRNQLVTFSDTEIVNQVISFKHFKENYKSQMNFSGPNERSETTKEMKPQKSRRRSKAMNKDK